MSVVTTVPLSTQSQQTTDQRKPQIPFDSERLDALHSKVAELQRTVDTLSRKNQFSWNKQQSNLFFPSKGSKATEFAFVST